MVDFDFKRLDEDKTYIDTKAKALVDFVIKHIEFLPYLCDCITTYTSLQHFEMKSEDGEDLFLEYAETFEFENEDSYDYVDEFVEVFRDTYNIYNDSNNVNEYENYIQNSVKVEMKYNEFCQNQLGNVRGRILEILLEEFIEKRYKPNRSRVSNYFLKFQSGCRIKLNGKELTLKNRKTVDIAAWDGSMGEFYEAKINPERFDEDVLNLLTLIKNALDNAKVNAIVGCVSMKEKETMIVCMEKVIEEQNINYNSSIQVYGKNELHGLLHNRPDISPAA